MSGESFCVSGGEKQKKVGLVYICVCGKWGEREYCRMKHTMELNELCELNSIGLLGCFMLIARTAIPCRLGPSCFLPTNV